MTQMRVSDHVQGIMTGVLCEVRVKFNRNEYDAAITCLHTALNTIRHVKDGDVSFEETREFSSAEKWVLGLVAELELFQGMIRHKETFFHPQ